MAEVWFRQLRDWASDLLHQLASRYGQSLAQDSAMARAGLHRVVQMKTMQQSDTGSMGSKGEGGRNSR